MHGTGSKGITRRLFTAGLTAAPILAQPAFAQAQATTLVYSDHEPLGNMRTRFLAETVFPAIEQQSKGALKIEPHWNGELSISYDAFQKLATDDAIDLATVVPEYAADQMPLHQLFKSFPVGPTGQRQVEFFRRAYDEIPELSAEMAASGLKVVYLGTGFPLAFYGTAPLADLPGMKGQRWRTASFWHRAFLTSAGAEPVTIPWSPEIPAAMRAGELEGLMVNLDSGYDLKVHEVAPNILMSKNLWLGHLYMVAMKSRDWDALSDDQRAAITSGVDQSYGSLGAAMDAGYDWQVEELRKAGATLRELSNAEVAAFATASQYQKAQDDWVAEQPEALRPTAASVLQKLRAIMADYVRA